MRGSGTPGLNDEYTLNPVMHAQDSDGVSPVGVSQQNPFLGLSMGKDQNISLITKDYVDAEKKILRFLAQRYELKEELGRGAHGRIYSGRDKISKQPIAIKVVSLYESFNKYVQMEKL